MLDVIVTFIQDRWGRKVNRLIVTSALAFASFLISLMYCTKAGYYILDGVDRWINNMTLIFVVWSEMVFSQSVYRWRDVEAELGAASYWIYNAGYFLGQILGVAVGHAVSPAAGAGVGFGIYVVGLVASLIMAKTPIAEAPRFWGRNKILSKFWFLAFYQVCGLSTLTRQRKLTTDQGNQLRRDLNVIVGAGKNWKIPLIWGPLLRYISAPVLAIVFSFAYPEVSGSCLIRQVHALITCTQFYDLRYDPPYIFGFILAHIVMLAVLFGFCLPRYLDVFVPPERREDGVKNYGANVTEGLIEAEATREAEEGSGIDSNSNDEKPKKHWFSKS